MKIHASPSFDKRPPADVLVLPLWEEEGKGAYAAAKKDLPKSVAGMVSHPDVTGKEGEITLLYREDELEPRILLLGLGKERECSAETLRRAYSALCKEALQRKAWRSLNLLLPIIKGDLAHDRIRGLVEGFLLPHYAFPADGKEGKGFFVEQLTLCGASTQERHEAEKISILMQSVYYARDLVNGNADTITPAYLAGEATKLAKEHKSVTAKILDLPLLEKEKLGLILAVGRAGMHEPRLIILHYKGKPTSKETTLLVGKGITYDTGGLNIKPTGSMETMRTDMGGAATVLGTMQALAALEVGVNVTAIIPSCENGVDSRSYKPGDVYTSYSGKTVEIGNTDAEGRLVLADAIAYGKKKFHPTRIIDVATLTGAAQATFGSELIALMGNDKKLTDQLFSSGERTYERVWLLPLYDEYRDYLKSDVADICNIPNPRYAGTITAGKFLEEFVGDTPWAHFDIAGKACLANPLRYLPKNGTGICVRLLVDFFRHTH